MKNRKDQKKQTAILTVHCPDQKGIVAAVTSFLYKNSGNILYLDQHVDENEEAFFMRIEWDLENFKIPAKEIASSFEKVSRPFNMNQEIYFSWDTPRMAIFASSLTHCLDDILARFHSNEWNVEIPLIISNHEVIAARAENVGIDFFYSSKDADNKVFQEEKEIKLLKEFKIDFIILARYMQILSPAFIQRYENKIINIHHSFLPAFPGAKPYHSAFERGVKIIGATSHYVTEDLDAGPIIEQDVTHITHRDNVMDMIRKGRDLEKIVLARAIHAHLARKIMVYKNKTIVFS